MGKKCPGVSQVHRHTNLSGRRPMSKDKGKGKGVKKKQPTKGAALYPALLCKSWAAAVRTHVYGAC